MLSLNQVSKSFGGIQAVRDCSFDIPDRRVTCLIGPNGAGKTTIFNLVTGFLKPDSGHVLLDSQEIAGRSPEWIVSRGIARSFQDLRLFQEMTVLENVMVAAPSHAGESILNLFLRIPAVRRDERENKERALASLDFVGLVPQAGEKVANLSHGEQKLLSIARMLMTNADVLLLDEPASGLDGQSLQQVLDLVRRLISDGKTVLLIEHNMQVVQKVADVVVFLHQGHVLATGDPETVTKNEQLTHIYFGGINDEAV